MTSSNISSIREHVAQARGLLLTPEPDFTQVMPQLQAAAEGLQALAKAAPLDSGARARWKSEVAALRGDLRRLAALAQSGEEFMRGWGRVLGTGTYSPDGALQPLGGVLTHKVSVEG
jgi:hypothetical protein